MGHSTRPPTSLDSLHEATRQANEACANLKTQIREFRDTKREWDKAKQEATEVLALLTAKHLEVIDMYARIAPGAVRAAVEIQVQPTIEKMMRELGDTIGQAEQTIARYIIDVMTRALKATGVPQEILDENLPTVGDIMATRPEALVIVLGSEQMVKANTAAAAAKHERAAKRGGHATSRLRRP